MEINQLLALAKRCVVIIPANNEEEVLPQIIFELQDKVPGIPVVVGANGCTDATVRLAAGAGAAVAVTGQRGYGYGCVAGVELADRLHPQAEAYIFMAADGANNPSDIYTLLAAYEHGFAIALGSRTRGLGNFSVMGLRHYLINRFFGLWCGMLTGRLFSDLGPLRLIQKAAFHEMRLRELTYGWTIEAQIKAVRMGLPICEVAVEERYRLAGKQKVSRVNWRHSLKIGSRILLGGLRTRFVRLENSRTFRIGDEARGFNPAPVAAEE